MGLQEGLTRKEKDLFISAVADRWKKWKNGRVSKEEVWDECFKAYLSEFADNAEIQEFRSQRWVPVSFEAVENVKAQKAKALFPAGNFSNARGDNDQAAKYEKLRTIYMGNRLEAADVVEKYSSSHIWQNLVFGNSPYMLGWEARSSRSRHSYKDDDGNQQAGIQYTDSEGQLQVYRTSPYVYDGPSYEPLDLFNFVRSPFADDVSQGEIKIYRSLISKAELLALAEEEINGYSVYDLKAVKKALDTKDDAPKESSDSQAQTRKEHFGISSTDTRDEDTVELLWAHGDFSIENHLWRDYIVVLVNREDLIRCEKSPFLSGLSPLRMSSLIPVKGLPYGLGILESALGQQDIINIRTNQVIDCMALTLNPVVIADLSRVNNVEDIISAPGAVWDVEETVPPPIVPVFLPQQAFQGYTEANIHKAEFVDATFSHKNFGAQTREQTATEVATSASAIQTVLGRMAQRAENIDLEQIFLWFDETEKQYFDPSREVFARYSDDDQRFEQITPEVIFQHYTWKATGSGATAMAEVRLQQLFQWAIAMAQTPAAGDVSYVEVGRAALRDMGRRDAEKLMPGLQEKMNEAQQTGEVTAEVMAAVQAQQGAGPGGASIPPGSRNPQGLAPSGRGAIPNAGGGQI